MGLIALTGFEFWDWGQEAPIKIDCPDYQFPGDLPYQSYGCYACEHRNGRNPIIALDFTASAAFVDFWECSLGHNTCSFILKRAKRPRDGNGGKEGRQTYRVMYRTYEPHERPRPIPATLIQQKVDEIAEESKPILPAKEKAYGNLFPGGSKEVARRIVEKAQRLTGEATSDENVDDTERDLYNYIAIHRACRERENDG